MGGLSPAKTTTRSGVMCSPRRSPALRGHGAAQHLDALGIGGVRLAEVDLMLELLGDVRGQREIGLADIAEDDAPPPFLDAAEVRRDLEGVLVRKRATSAAKRGFAPGGASSCIVMPPNVLGAVTESGAASHTGV